MSRLQRKTTARTPSRNIQTANPTPGGNQRVPSQPHMRPGVPGPSRDRPRPSGGHTIEVETKESNDTPEFLTQLQAWAQNTVLKGLNDLEGEFARLQALPRPEPCEQFKNNQQLNRYRDVVCVDNNRVSLTNGRYIHANWIDANDGERRFICTQGPLPNTVDDFWTMVLQEKIEAAVMLCDTLELGRTKCAQYWPEKAGDTLLSEDKNISVQQLSQEPLDAHLFKTRLLVESKDPAHKQIVRHFHWRKWPDRGVPTNHLAALRLLHFLGAYKRIVVHCSAGIGRTGTVVAIYLAQNQLRAGKPLELQEQVQKLRQQRAGSVQSMDQYLYIYSVLLKYAKNKADRKQIELDLNAVQQLIQAIAKRIYKTEAK